MRAFLSNQAIAPLLLAVLLWAPGAQASVTISSAATQNMTCSNGTCAPTANKAVLNAGDLENLLASGSVIVTTTGSGVQANDIHVSSILSWASSNTLSLDAHRSIAVNSAVSITGLSGLTVQTGGKKGTLSFGKKGNINFANLSSQLAINSNTYTLVGDIKTLAADIAANPNGFFALANAYDATGDRSAPIPTVFEGRFEGLNNVISNLGVFTGINIGGEVFEGLFAEVGANGTLADVGLVNANIKGTGASFSEGILAGGNLGTVQSCQASGSVLVEKEKAKNTNPAGGGLVGSNWGSITGSHAATVLTGQGKDSAAGLVGYNAGVVAHSYASGTVSGLGYFGGLVSLNTGTISNSYATGAIKGGGGAAGTIGGLVGTNMGTVSGSYATGSVGSNRLNSNVGGLVGWNQASIVNSYATGNVSNGFSAGGLVGWNDEGTIIYSYSTGAPSGTTYVGGLAGADASQAGNLNDTYWDLDTSGITDPSQGAGNIANDPGITGLTTAELQSGLPAGFDPAVWAEKPNINGGFPYLLANPPLK